MSRKRLVTVILVICIGAAAFLFYILGAPETWTLEINSLDKKKNDVTAMAVSASGASVAISMLPGDIATPIAEQLAEVSKSFAIILAILYSEKYLLTILGRFSTILAIISLSIGLYFHLTGKGDKRHDFRIRKMLIFAIAIGSIIPMGLAISDMIENVYQYSIEVKMQEAINGETTLNEISMDEDTRNIFEKAGEWVGAQFRKLVDKTNDLVEKAKTALSNYIETFAVMFVIDCVIPILTIMAYAMVIKWLFGLKYGIKDVDNVIGYSRLRNGLSRAKTKYFEADEDDSHTYL